MKRELIITPRITLPMRPTGMDTIEMDAVEEETPSHPTRPVKRRKRPRRNVRQALWVVIRELVFLLVAGDLGTMAYWYLAPWPVYRVVSFVVIFILWSNFASSTARVKTKQAIDMLSTVSMQAVQVGKRPQKRATTKTPRTIEDTATYLEAIQKEHYENIETRRLRAVVPHDGNYRNIFHAPETASD